MHLGADAVAPVLLDQAVAGTGVVLHRGTDHVQPPPDSHRPDPVPQGLAGLLDEFAVGGSPHLSGVLAWLADDRREGRVTMPTG